MQYGHGRRRDCISCSRQSPPSVSMWSCCRSFGSVCESLIRIPPWSNFLQQVNQPFPGYISSTLVARLKGPLPRPSIAAQCDHGSGRTVYLAGTNATCARKADRLLEICSMCGARTPSVLSEYKSNQCRSFVLLEQSVTSTTISNPIDPIRCIITCRVKITVADMCGFEACLAVNHLSKLPASDTFLHTDRVRFHPYVIASSIHTIPRLVVHNSSRRFLCTIAQTAYQCRPCAVPIAAVLKRNRSK